MEELAERYPPEREEIRAAAENRAAEIVSELLSRDNPFLCCVHPEQEAAASCRRCGRPLCFRCFSDSYPELLCPECRTRQHRRELIRGGFRALKLPVLWVMLCVILSGTVYLAGFNNPSLKAMVRRDARRRWFQQEAPRLCLMRAAREYRRAEKLRRDGDTKRALRWAANSARDFSESARLWRDAPVYPLLRFGEANALALCGEQGAAQRLLQAIKVPLEHPLTPALRFRQGEWAEESGDKAAAKEYFRASLSAAMRLRQNSLNQFLDHYLTNPVEGSTFFSVLYTCNGSMVYEEVVEKLLPRRELDFPELEEVRRMENASEQLKKAVGTMRESRRGDGEFQLEQSGGDDFTVERRP